MKIANRLKRQPLVVALSVLALAAAHVIAFMILASPTLAIMGYLTVGLAFLIGIVLLPGSLLMNLSSWRTHTLALAILAGVFAFYFVGGSLIHLLHYRTRLVLALTGGQKELQSWAADILTQPRDQTEYEAWPYVIDRQHWPRQVRRLRPVKVSIQPMFKDGQEGVILYYPIPHEVLAIVIGPPGAVPPDDADRRGSCRRFGDGLYYLSS